jgi:hypothetical protein
VAPGRMPQAVAPETCVRHRLVLFFNAFQCICMRDRLGFRGGNRGFQGIHKLRVTGSSPVAATPKSGECGSLTASLPHGLIKV